VNARDEVVNELVSGLSGLVLALFMWGHVSLVGSILTGARGFDWVATMLEDYYIAQPTVAAIFLILLVHAVFASRKIPAKLAERRQVIALTKGLRDVPKRRTTGEVHADPFEPHTESLLWIWQVRTGMVILVLASFHLVLLGLDTLTPLFGERAGIESITSSARVRGGLWLPYAILLVCVEFHASVGLYRLAIKWGAGSRISRGTLHVAERIIFWLILVIGFLTLAVLGGVMDPPLTWLLTGGSS